MYSFPEKEFTINGIKSWVHCVYREHHPSLEPKTLSYHYHNYIEILYALCADANVWVNGKCHNFMTGDLAIINSEALHVVTSNEPTRYICIKFSPHILYANEQSLFEFKYVTPFLSQNRDKIIYKKDELQNINIAALAGEIMDEWDEKSIAYELNIRANILKIFTQILRMRSLGNSLSDKPLAEHIKKAIAYMHENFNSATEKDAADLCGLSYNYFSHSFKSALGKSFNDYLTQIKLREAEKQLILTDKSITEIAQDTGFSTSSHFILRFKEAKQITPSKFRKNISENAAIN